MFFFCILGRIGNEYNKTNVFGKEINQYYQLILNINTLDELEAVGNPVKLNEREKVLEALRINRENLVRALQTERILRENPQFRPEQFNIDLSGLRSLQATEKATEEIVRWIVSRSETSSKILTKLGKNYASKT